MLLPINAEKQTERILKFIQKTLKTQGFKNVIIAASGGIDSTTTLYLLARAVEPKHIFVVHLPFAASFFPQIEKLTSILHIPKANVFEVSIKSIVDEMVKGLGLNTRPDLERVRIGSVMARIRMIILYDLAKKHKALVCGTENKSEYYLGYFTRFGDEASDFEPIRHLYKTQVYKLAEYLGVPTKIIKQAPTAGLWPGQTDEEEFGFTYKEADMVFHLYFEKKKSVKEIKKRGFANADKIIEYSKKNNYKHLTPYTP